MFLPRPMRQVNIFVQESDVEVLTTALARLEVFDLHMSQEQQWDATPGEPWSELADTYADQQQRLAHVLQTLQIEDRSGPVPDQLHPGEDVTHTEEQLREAEHAVQMWQSGKTDLEETIEQSRLLLQELRLLDPLDVPVDQLQHTRYLYLKFGTLPTENLARLRVVLFHIPFLIVPFHTYDERVLVFAATDQDHAPVLERALSSVFLEPLDLPEEQELSGPVGEVIAVLEQRLATAEKRQAELQQERNHLVQQWQEPLLALWQQVSGNLTVTDTINRLGCRNGIYLVPGWVPQDALEKVMTTVRQVTQDRANIEVVEPVPGGPRRVPTLLRNPPFLRSFETLVSNFGLPDYDEIDPTPLAALTFALMFGIMFGDIGHGLLLVLAALWLRRARKNLRSLANILLTAGLSSMLFGVLYGSLFGREDILPRLWLSPLEGILSILITSVVFGVVLLNIGFLLHLFSSWRSRNWSRLLFDESGVAGIALYWVLLGGALLRWQGIAFPLLLWVLLALVPAALLFLQGPLGRLVSGQRPLLEESWGEYGILAFFELFAALISYFSHSFSFIRLGAFAVAHAALSQVVFILANLVGGPWRWLIIILGTLVVVGFEGLIIGIQALRLEYYEFFGRFFQGRGRAFAPLRLSGESKQV